MGLLSKTIAYSTDHVRDPTRLQTMVDDVLAFSQILQTQWRQLSISKIDALAEATELSSETRDKTLPVLWRLLRSALFVVTILLKGVIGRVLNDRALAVANGTIMCASAYWCIVVIDHLQLLVSCQLNL